MFFKLFPKRQFAVYNAEIFFVTSYNPMAWVVKRAKLNSKKGVLWDTWVDMGQYVSTLRNLKNPLHLQAAVNWSLARLLLKGSIDNSSAGELTMLKVLVSWGPIVLN